MIEIVTASIQLFAPIPKAMVGTWLLSSFPLYLFVLELDSLDKLGDEFLGKNGERKSNETLKYGLGVGWAQREEEAES